MEFFFSKGTVMSSTSVLKAGDIVLRPATEADIDARLAFGNDADIAEMYGKNRSDIPQLTREGVQDWVGWLMSHPHAWIIEKMDRRSARFGWTI